jgi:hypothetical protein
MPAQPSSNAHDIVFNLKLVADPGNADTAKKFGGGVIPPGGSGTRPGGGGAGNGPGGNAYAAWWKKTLADQEKEEERVHKRSRERQLERATRHRQAREEETKVAAKQLAAQEREEERAHHRHRQRQLERARANRAATGDLVAQSRAQADATRSAAISDRARQVSLARSRGMAGRSFAMNTRRAGMEMGEGITALVGGAAALGLVGEANQQKVQDTALMVGGGIAVGRGVSKIGQGLAGGASAMGMTAGAGGMALGAAAVAAIASVTLALTELAEVANGTAGDVGSVTATVGMFLEKNSRSGTGVYTSASEAEQKTNRLEANRAAWLSANSQVESERAAAHRDARMQAFARGPADLGDRRYRRGFNALDSRYNMPGITASADKAARLGFANELHASGAATASGLSKLGDDRSILAKDMARTRLRGLEANSIANMAVTPQQKAEGAAAQLAVQKEIVNQAQRERDLSRQTADVKIAGARDALRINTDILNTARSAMKEARNQYQSAEVRFGNMDEADQARAMKSGAKVKEAMGLIKAGKREEGMAMLMKVPKADREFLGGLGLGETTKGVDLAAKNEARMKGFGETFGTEEKARFSRNEDITKKVEATLKDQREYIVKVESDEDEIVRRMTNQLQVQIDRVNARFDAAVREGFRSSEAIAKRKALEAARAIPGG